MRHMTFDHIAAELVARVSRRSGLRAALGAAIAGPLFGLGLTDVDARKRKRQGMKGKHRPRVPPTPPAGGECPADQLIDGVCCPTEQILRQLSRCLPVRGESELLLCDE